MLEVAGVRKRFGDVVALDGLDLTVAPGEVVGLVGHNGAGKTTAVGVVTGLVRPDAGTVRVAGVDALARPRAARAQLGVAAQELQLYVTATVRQNVRLCAALAGVPRRARGRAVADVLDELALGSSADRPVALLSGGQRRRVQAACALVGAPGLLLLDEPTVGADPTTRADLLAAVRARAARGAAVLYTTHYLPELVELGASLAVVRAGRVVARGSQAELLARLPSRVVVSVERASATPADAEPSAGVPVDVLVAALPPGDEVVSRAGDWLEVRTAEPGLTLARLAAAGPRLRTVDVRHANLDDLFASLGDDPVPGDTRAA